MSLAVTQCVETADSELGRVVEMRPGWLKTAYAQRGDALTKLNVVEYVDKIGMPKAEQPSEPPMVNYRYYFDMPKFAELRTAAETDPAVDLQITAEMQAMPAGGCTPSWFLKQYQLKECGLCATREGKLSICNGCRSFVYCCSEHQAARSLLTGPRSTDRTHRPPLHDASPLRSAHQVADWKAKHKFVCLKRKEWPAIEEASQ